MGATWVQDWAWAFAAGAWTLWALAALVLWVALFKDRSRGRRRCPKCWYDMTGVPGLKCPECGREARKEKKLFSTRRRWNLAAFGLVLALIGIASHRAPTALRHGVWAAVPIPVLNLVLGLFDNEAQSLRQKQVRLIQAGFASSVAVAALSEWQRLLLASVVEEPALARELVRTLGFTGAKRQLLEVLLDSEMPRVRETVVLELTGQFRRLEGIPELISSLIVTDPDPTVRLAAVQAVTTLAPSNECWAEPLIAALNDENSDVRIAAATVHVQCLWSASAQAEAIRQSAANSNTQVRCLLLVSAAHCELSQEERLTLLNRALNEDPAGEVRAVALRSLYTVSQDMEGLAKLASQYLDDPSSHVVLTALNVLGRIGPPAAAALDRIRELETSPDPRIAASALDARKLIEGW